MRQPSEATVPHSPSSLPGRLLHHTQHRSTNPPTQPQQKNRATRGGASIHAVRTKTAAGSGGRSWVPPAGLSSRGRGLRSGGRRRRSSLNNNHPSEYVHTRERCDGWPLDGVMVVHPVRKIRADRRLYTPLYTYSLHHPRWGRPQQWRRRRAAGMVIPTPTRVHPRCAAAAASIRISRRGQPDGATSLPARLRPGLLDRRPAAGCA